MIDLIHRITVDKKQVFIHIPATHIHTGGSFRPGHDTRSQLESFDYIRLTEHDRHFIYRFPINLQSAHLRAKYRLLTARSTGHDHFLQGCSWRQIDCQSRIPVQFFQIIYLGTITNIGSLYLHFSGRQRQTEKTEIIRCCTGAAVHLINRSSDQRFGRPLVAYKATDCDLYLSGFILQNDYFSRHTVCYRKMHEQTSQTIFQRFIVRTERNFRKSVQQRRFVRKAHPNLLLYLIQDLSHRNFLSVQRHFSYFIHSVCLCLNAGQN